MKNIKTIAVIKRRGVPRGLVKSHVDGGTLNLLETINIFSPLKYKVHIFTTNEDMGESIEIINNIKIVRLNVWRSEERNDMSHDLIDGLEFSKTLIKCNEFIKIKFDYFYSHHWSSILPPILDQFSPLKSHIHIPHLLALEKSKFIGVKVPKKIIEYESYILHKADKIVALSNFEKQSIKNNYHVDYNNICIIPNGINTENKSTKKAFSNFKTPKRLISVGRISRQKGYEVLIKAVYYVCKRGCWVKCDIIGEVYRGEEEYWNKLQKMVKDYQLESNIRFLGKLNHNDVLSAICKVDIYVQSSHYESQGIALLEAMSRGLPIVASDLPVVKDFVKHNINGILFSMGNDEELGEYLMCLINDNKLAHRLGSEAARITSIYNWTNTKKLLINCFQ